MPLGLLTGLGAALAWGTLDIFAALASQRIGSLKVTTGIQVLGATFVILLAVAHGTTFPTDPVVLIGGALVGLAGAGAYLAYFTGLRIGPIAVVSGMVAAYGGLTVVLAVVIRGESLTATAGDRCRPRDHRRHPHRVPLRWRAARHPLRQPRGHLRDRRPRPLRDDGDQHGHRHRLRRLARRAPRVAHDQRHPQRGHPDRGGDRRASDRPTAAHRRGRHRRLGRHLPRVDLGWSGSSFASILDILGLVVFMYGLENAETWLVGLASSFGPAVTIIAAVAFLGERLRPIQWIGLTGVLAG